MLNISLKFKQILSKSLIEQSCLLCASTHHNEHGICQPCFIALPWHKLPQCPQCGLQTQISGSICGNCLSYTPDFDATHTLFTYDFPVDRLLQHYKYNNSLHLSHTFAQLLYENKLKRLSGIDKIDLIIPMPMHPTRLKERGFNQALEIARILSKRTHIKLDYSLCKRSKHTPPQASLPLKERIKNIRDAFDCQQNVDGLNIAIVDDVMTTGASLNELAKTLKQAGATHVECWAIARTLPENH
jgi:ComF family protein